MKSNKVSVYKAIYNIAFSLIGTGVITCVFFAVFIQTQSIAGACIFVFASLMVVMGLFMIWLTAIDKTVSARLND